MIVRLIYVTSLTQIITTLVTTHILHVQRNMLLWYSLVPSIGTCSEGQQCHSRTSLVNPRPRVVSNVIQQQPHAVLTGAWGGAEL